MSSKSQSARKMNRILILVTCGFMLYAAVNIIGVRMEISEKKDNMQKLEGQIDEQSLINAELYGIIDEGATDEAIASVAKDKLGLADAGERIIVDIGSK